MTRCSKRVEKQISEIQEKTEKTKMEVRPPRASQREDGTDHRSRLYKLSRRSRRKRVNLVVKGIVIIQGDNMFQSLATLVERVQHAISALDIIVSIRTVEMAWA